jgi:hypothetical protein
LKIFETLQQIDAYRNPAKMYVSNYHENLIITRTNFQRILQKSILKLTTKHKIFDYLKINNKP